MKGKCPKVRRPDPFTKLCKEGYYVKNNAHDILCCYKNKKVVVKLPKEKK